MNPLSAVSSYVKSPRKLRKATLAAGRTVRKVVEVLRDLSDPCSVCGITTVWATGEKDPFLSACKTHDAFYTEDPKIRVVTRKQVDNKFLKDMLEIAKKNESLISRAHVYYRLARTLGWLWW